MSKPESSFWQTASNIKDRYHTLREEYGPAAHGFNENAKWAARTLGDAWTKYSMDDRLSFGTLLGGIGAKSGHHITHYDLDTGLMIGVGLGIVFGKKAWDAAKRWAYGEPAVWQGPPTAEGQVAGPQQLQA